MNNTNYTSINNYSNINNVSKLINSGNVSSPKYKKINPKQKNNKRPGYKSPKIKHTKSPLHYDYSTYANEDCEKCDNRTHLLNHNNQSMISLRSNGNKFGNNFSDYNEKENDNDFVSSQNERTNCHCCHFCNCCGCCGHKNFLVNITTFDDKNNSLMDSC